MVDAPVLVGEHLTIVHARRGREPLVAVNDVALDVGRGEIVGIIGESGSGKTSLSMAVAGIGPLTSGTLRIAGTTPGTIWKGDERAAVQVIFQDPVGSLDPRQRIGRGLHELRRVHPRRTSWITDEALFERVGLSSQLLQRYPQQLSGGQAQRIAIARAILLRPTLLVADEPTSALDVRVQAQIIVLLRELREANDLAILFVSHDFGVVRALCDRVNVMYQGEFVESGPTGDVFDSPQHEYTRRLVAAVPSREGMSRRRSAIAS